MKNNQQKELSKEELSKKIKSVAEEVFYGDKIQKCINYFEFGLEPFKVESYNISSIMHHLSATHSQQILDLVFSDLNYKDDELESFFYALTYTDKGYELLEKSLTLVINNPKFSLDTYFKSFAKGRRRRLFLLKDNTRLSEKLYNTRSEEERYKKINKSDLTSFAKTIVESKELSKVFIDQILQKSYYLDDVIRHNVNFLHAFYSENVKNKFHDLLYPYDKLDSKIVNIFLNIDFKAYEDIVYTEFEITSKKPHHYAHSFSMICKLYNLDKNKYRERFLEFITVFIDFVEDKNSNIETVEDISTDKFDGENINWGAESIVYWVFYYLREISNEQFETRIKNFCKNAQFMPVDIIPMIKEHFKNDSLPLLKDVFNIKNYRKNYGYGYDYHKALFESIADLEWQSEINTIWKFVSKLDYGNQLKIVPYLIKKPKVVLPFAEKGIQEKSKTERLLSFYIFININTEHTKKLLWNYFHKEKIDAVRELILPTINRIFYKEEFSLKQVNKIIDFAVERDAFTKGLKGVPLDFEKLPDIYLKDGKKLNENQVKFLIYRMSLIKIMVSDVEAKLLLNHIDKSKSNEFAKAILESFLDKGAVAKQKYIMCLAGILGNNNLLDFLKKLFLNLFNAKRMKMTQYVVSTMAMIGSDEALRQVEYYSRKYKSKAALHDACIEALENAAEELGMDIYELSDKIIPDFGFDGLYKTIEINDEEFRVFVANDFKLQFITEEGKVRKSVPKGATKELKAELKTIQKEIREVNRAQKEKLEQYMVLERRWNLDNWTKFYLMNPVMFIYASSLVWGVFDDENKVQKIFYVDQDASILDIEDDEIEIENGKIGIVHPLRFSEEQKKEWQTKFYNYEIMQPFKQLDRTYYDLLDEEYNENSIERYQKKGAQKGSRATQGYFEKRGWRKEMSDSGCFDLIKTFKQDGIYAFLNVYGLCIGWYDEVVEFQDIHFKKEADIFSAWDKKKIPLKDIPEIVFSEVIADMEGIVKIEEKNED